MLVHRDDDDGAARFFHKARRHDADDARVPVAAPEQDDPVLQDAGLGVQQLLRRLHDLLLRLLPGGVDLRQAVGQLGGAVFVLTEDELQGGHGAVHPARRVDAGRDGIADVLGRDGLARQAHLVQQGDKARAVGLLQLPQARFYQGAVLARQGHHIGHGAHSGQIAAVFQHLLRGAAVQRCAELKGYARAAQALEGAGIVFPAGVHHRHRSGQTLMGQVVVGDDEVHAQLSGKIRLVQRGDAVIHRHDERVAFFVDGLDGVFGQAVAVALAAGQHALDVGAHPFQMLVEQGRGRYAVHIVVAKHHDGLLVVNGLQDARAGLVHILQKQRVAQLFLARQQRQRLGGVGDAPGGKDARQQRTLLLLGGKGALVLRLAPGFPAGAVVFQFFGVLFRNGVGQLPHGGAVQGFDVPCPAGH